MFGKSSKIVLFLALQLLLVECLKKPDIAKAKDALKKIKDGVKDLKDNTIFKNVVTAGKIIGHSAIAIKNLVLLIQTFTGGATESKELKYMREQFAIVNTKLDALDQDFADLKNHIDWTVMKVNIGEFERKIRAIERMKEAYMNAPPEAAKFFAEMFLNSFRRHYKSSAYKIYVVMAETLIYQDNIIYVARKQMKEHLAHVAQFASYILRIIQRGIVLENMDLTMQDKSLMQEQITKEWASRFKNLEQVAAKMDKDIRDAWSTQYKLDINEIAVRNPEISNQDMVSKIYGHLAEKFPWRWFFVLVFSPGDDNDDHHRYFENCGGYLKDINNGKKVIIANSLPAGTTGLKRDPSLYFRNLQKKMQISCVACAIYFMKYDKGCHKHYFVGVFAGETDPRAMAPQGHFQSYYFENRLPGGIEGYRYFPYMKMVLV